MNSVSVTCVNVYDNPAPFTDAFKFEVVFEAMTNLKEDLEWKIIYVGSAKDQNHDQVLDSVLIGPVSAGVNKFILQTPPPDPKLIPKDDLLGVTALLIIASYKGQEFTRVGYYVSNQSQEAEQENKEPIEVTEKDVPTETVIFQPESEPKTEESEPKTEESEPKTEESEPKTEESEPKTEEEKMKELEKPIPTRIVRPEEIIRTVLNDQPRVTVRAIKWDTTEEPFMQTEELNIREEDLIEDDIDFGDENEEEEDIDNEEDEKEKETEKETELSEPPSKKQKQEDKNKK